MSSTDLYVRLGEALARLRAAELRWIALVRRRDCGELSLGLEIDRARERMHALRPAMEALYTELDAAISRGVVPHG